ncbi:hypothetical protein HJC23_011028 [Cyclotella cryptica]|uniref:JmjC domain-containing protein n=1 Tax=Cyclotella cryptica TaxID=29204 RepID=A0ABD3PEW7_9STRA
MNNRIRGSSVSNLETAPPIASMTKKLQPLQAKPTSDSNETTATNKKSTSSESVNLTVSARDKQRTNAPTSTLQDSSSENDRGDTDRRRSKRAKVQVKTNCKSTMAASVVEKSAAASSVHLSPKSDVAKPKVKYQSALSFNVTQIDSEILDKLTDQSSLEFYHEESAYRYHNPPFPERGPSQLALVRDEKIPGKLHPMQHDELKPLPLPSQIPELPSTGFCTWSYDEKTRVLLANFRVHDRKVCVAHEDEQFLLKMMERDDITVISQGLLDEINSSLLGREYLEGVVGSRFHHKVKEFKKTLNKPRDSIPTGEVNDKFEESGWYSMKISDYFEYVDRRLQIQGCNIINAKGLDGCDGNTGKHFDFTNDEGRNISIDPREVVLYMLDLDMVKMLPRAYDKFMRSFKLPSVLPGGLHCMMNAVNLNGRPFMGPNIYITPPSSFTYFHQDGNGTVDSEHYCHRGYNEVIMLRRLPERHKHHALHLFTGRSTFTHGFLYGKPHDQNTQLRWPTNEAIEECIRMGLHAFRKLSHLPLHEADCHCNLRNEILPSISQEDLVCVSVAWDWMFKGITSQGINREVASILECARLNHTYHVQSLGIPETALLFMAEENIARLKIKDSSGTSAGLIEFTPDPKTVLRGILPSLQFIVHRHLMTEKISMTSVKAGKHTKVSVHPKPNAWENPDLGHPEIIEDAFSMDPYESGDFICKFCSEELSNVYMHCDGCERLLNKDFNICASCHANENYKANIKMHPFNPKMKSTLNHTGIQFTLHYRFMLPEEELEILRKAETAVGDAILPASLETKVRLFSLLPRDFHCHLEAFPNDGICAGLDPSAASSTVDLASNKPLAL